MCGFQRLVSHRRWRAHRSADHLGCAQPLSAVAGVSAAAAGAGVSGNYAGAPGASQRAFSLEAAAPGVCQRGAWGERIGLLPREERWYTVYFAHLPLGSFDSWQRRVLPLPKAPSFYIAEAGDGEECSPSPAPLPLTEREQRL
jgi:hypothetical protein